MKPQNDPFYPPPAPDDTQPSIPFRLAAPGRRRPLAWSLILLIAGLTQLGLIVAGGLFLLDRLLDAPEPLRVTLLVNSDIYHLDTQAHTVGDFLQEHNIVLAQEDILSPPASTPLTPGVIVQIRQARDVTLTVDKEIRTVRTAFDNPLDILNSAGVAVSAYDLVLLDGTQTDATKLLVWPVPVTNITIKRAVTLKISDGGAAHSVITTAPTIGEALFEANIPLYLGDIVTPDLNTAPSSDVMVVIDRSRPVTIIADGVTIETRTRGQTVGAALAEAQVILSGLDYAIPSETTPLLPGVSIRVIRVREELLTEQENLAYETIYQPDATLELDQRAVLQEGQNGVREKHIRVRYENGIEIQRELEQTIVTREPVNRVIAYGTNVVLRTVETPEGPRQYWRKFRMLATSYHPEALDGDNITATGRVLTKGIVAIDPGIIRYGTQLFVPGYGLGVAADTGGPRSTRYWIDLGYDDENYVAWARWVDVYLLTPVPDKIEYLLPQ